jgi:hypothetical protein
MTEHEDALARWRDEFWRSPGMRRGGLGPTASERAQISAEISTEAGRLLGLSTAQQIRLGRVVDTVIDRVLPQPPWPPSHPVDPLPDWLAAIAPGGRDER